MSLRLAIHVITSLALSALAVPYGYMVHGMDATNLQKTFIIIAPLLAFLVGCMKEPRSAWTR